MKTKIAIICIVLFFYSHVIAQEAKTKTIAEISNAAKFSEKSGTLIQKEFVEIGKIKGTKISLYYLTDLISGVKVSAIRFEKEVSTEYRRDSKIAILDADEVNALIKSLKIIKEKMLTPAPDNYTEVNYISRGGFSAGCYCSKYDWTAFLQLEKYDSDSYEWIKKEDLDSFIVLLESNKSKL